MRQPILHVYFIGFSPRCRVFIDFKDKLSGLLLKQQLYELLVILYLLSQGTLNPIGSLELLQKFEQVTEEMLDLFRCLCYSIALSIKTIITYTLTWFWGKIF